LNYKLTNIRIITCNGDNVIESGEILFNETGIIEVGQSIRSQSLDAIEIDGTGMTVLPGLMDSHVHLGMDASPDPFAKMRDDSAADIAFKAVQQGYEFLKSGITSVRNLGTRYNVDITYRDAVKDQVIQGPRVFAAGQPIIMTGGHGHVMAIEADGCDEVRKAAREQLKAGADLLKVMATGGVLTKGSEPGAAQLSEDEIRIACEEAQHVSKTTAAHAIGREGIRNAIRAGVTTIEHAYLLDEETVELMLSKGTYLVPTLLAPRLILDKTGTVPQYMIEKVEEIIEDHRISFRLAYEAGVPIVAGTDAGTPFNYPGLIAEELELMMEDGMSALEALKSATIVAAKAINMESMIGSIEAGKVADLIVVRGNPLKEIDVLKNIHHVFANGCLVYETNENTKVNQFHYSQPL